MLYANEIAGLYNMTKEENYLSARKVANILKKYAKDNNIVIKPLYYQTKFGLKKVYPKHLYEPAMIDFLKLGG